MDRTVIHGQKRLNPAEVWSCSCHCVLDLVYYYPMQAVEIHVQLENESLSGYGWTALLAECNILMNCLFRSSTESDTRSSYIRFFGVLEFVH